MRTRSQEQGWEQGMKQIEKGSNKAGNEAQKKSGVQYNKMLEQAGGALMIKQLVVA